MFVNASPCLYNAPETICSLTFAARCRNTELGSAKKSSSDSAGKYRKQIAALQDEIEQLKKGA
jgi:kinesin family protein C2/C3